MNIEAMALELPTVPNHPNRVPFYGILGYFDEESDKAPSGARGHRVILTKKAVTEALPSLMGMAINYKAGWDGHNSSSKFGIITAATLHKTSIQISGYVFGRDFPTQIDDLRKDDNTLGMSYELAEAHVENMREEVWTITKCMFTGAAVLRKNSAAYKKTTFSLGVLEPIKKAKRKLRDKSVAQLKQLIAQA